MLVGLPLPREAWAPTKKGAKRLAAGEDTAETVERHHGKTPDEAWEFASNQVLTSKYTLLTFLPKVRPGSSTSR